MRWSWKIARVGGIDIKIHATFWLLLVWVGASAFFTTPSVSAVLTSLAAVLALFVFVTLHELGHALTARYYGIPTQDIVLLPIGGVARMERLPNNPKEEFWITLAGPLVNLALALVFAVGLLLSGGLQSAADLSRSIWLQGVWMNVFLGLFNLIPAFPMDGGRILRAVLAARQPAPQATRTAAIIGQGIAFLFAVVGVLYAPSLLLIAVFVYLGAAQEVKSMQVKSALGGVRVADALLTDYKALHEGDALSQAVHYVVSTAQVEFPVLSGERVVGVLTREGLVSGLQRLGERAPVSAVMQSNFKTAAPDDPLEDAAQSLSQSDCHTLLVLNGEQLVGMVTLENIGEYLMIQAALKKNVPPLGTLDNRPYINRS